MATIGNFWQLMATFGKLLQLLATDSRSVIRGCDDESESKGSCLKTTDQVRQTLDPVQKEASQRCKEIGKLKRSFGDIVAGRGGKAVLKLC